MVFRSIYAALHHLLGALGAFQASCRERYASGLDWLQVLDECHKAMQWLNNKQGVQDTKRNTEDPELVTSDIKKKEETLVRFADPIINKPAPKPVSLCCHP